MPIGRDVSKIGIVHHGIFAPQHCRGVINCIDLPAVLFVYHGGPQLGDAFGAYLITRRHRDLDGRLSLFGEPAMFGVLLCGDIFIPNRHIEGDWDYQLLLRRDGAEGISQGAGSGVGICAGSLPAGTGTGVKLFKIDTFNIFAYRGVSIVRQRHAGGQGNGNGAAGARSKVRPDHQVPGGLMIIPGGTHHTAGSQLGAVCVAAVIIEPCGEGGRILGGRSKGNQHPRIDARA